MATVEKISVALTPEMAEMVREAVKSGEYASGSEVIRDALRDWVYKRDLRDQQVQELRRLWKEGIESGPSAFFTVEDIIAEAKKRLEGSK